jgi:membrane-associated phospholipid phosphatase
MSFSKLETRGSDAGTARTAEVLTTSAKTKDHAINGHTKPLPVLLFHRVRNFLLGRIKADVSFILQIQKYRSPAFIKVAQIISTTGAEAFYIAALGCFGFLWEMRFSVQWGVLLSIVLAVCNLLKNILYLPRPPTPPVKVYETQHDWGFPSTHTATAVSLGGFLVWYVTRYIFQDPSPAAMYSLVGSVLLWIFGIMATRIYLGVHSMTDVWGGLGMGVSLFWAYMSGLESLEKFLLTPFVPAKLWLLLLAVIIFHPRRHPTSSYYTSVTISSLGCGLLLGHLWFGSLNPSYRPHLPVHLTANPILSTILRCVLGSVAVFATKTVTKKVMYSVLSYLCAKFKIPHVKHREALIEAQPSFTHLGVIEQLPVALAVAKKAEKGAKAENGVKAENGMKAANGVNGHTHTHVHTHSGSGNGAYNGSTKAANGSTHSATNGMNGHSHAQNGHAHAHNGHTHAHNGTGNIAKTENGLHVSKENGFDASEYTLSAEDLARHKVNAELVLAQKPGFVLDLDIPVKVVVYHVLPMAGFAVSRIINWLNL